jgi:hypothetical protein
MSRPELGELIIAGKVAAVIEIVRGVDEGQRRVLADTLVADVRRRRDNWWFAGEAAALAVAAVGLLPTAAKVAAILGRRSVNVPHTAVDQVLAVAAERRTDWLPELARRLAGRITATDPTRNWALVAGLLVASGTPPPAGEVFVRGWLSHLMWPSAGSRQVPLVDRLRSDPFRDALLPRLFDADGAGASMAATLYAGPQTGVTMALPRALAQLAAEGTLERGMLLEGCLRRLLRVGHADTHRGFVALHDLLAPQPAETAPRAGDYLRLLTDGPAAVAAMAQKVLRALPEVDTDALLEASRVMLLRPEKALVRAHLTWLDRTARRLPERAGEIGTVLAVAADHPAADIRDRAGELATRHGVVPAAAPVSVAARDELAPPPAPAPAPPPIAGADELATEAAALFDAGISDMVALDRVLDGALRLAGADQARLSRVLTPVLDRVAGPFTGWRAQTLDGRVFAALRAAVDLRAATSLRAAWLARLANLRGRSSPATGRGSAPDWLIHARLAEIGAQIGPGRTPGLLSVPTSSTGAIAPEVLLDRVARLRGATPGRWDLAQALYRLPAGADEPLAAKAAAIGTPTGERLAAWLRDGGLAPPRYDVAPVTWSERTGTRWTSFGPAHQYTQKSGLRIHLSAPPGAEDPLGLYTISRHPLGYSYSDGHTRLWPALFPGYPALVASHALADVAMSSTHDVRGGAAVLPVLADCCGDGGAPLALALAYGLVARHEQDRAATLDALLLLAAAGRLDAAGVGGHLGTLGATGTIPIGRAVQPLRDAVAAGAPLSVWRLLAAALPALLHAPTPTRGTPDLLNLAAETGAATGVHLAVPGVREAAARTGSSRLRTEARRLAPCVADG